MVCFLVFACFWPLLPGIRPVYVEVFASLMNCVYVSKTKSLASISALMINLDKNTLSSITVS